MADPNAHIPIYGIDKDLKKKRDAAYDPALEREAQNWIQQIIGEQFPDNFANSLKSGVILCKLANKIRPGAVSKINAGKMPFMQMENINAYLQFCRKLGVADHDLFMTVDLFEQKNMNAVVQNIHSVGRHAQSTGFRGPTLGAKISDRHEVHFTQQQLNSSASSVPLLTAKQMDTQKAIGHQGPGIGREIVKNDKWAANANAAVPLLTAKQMDTQKAIGKQGPGIGREIVKGGNTGTGNSSIPLFMQGSSNTAAAKDGPAHSIGREIVKTDRKASATPSWQSSGSHGQANASGQNNFRDITRGAGVGHSGATPSAPTRRGSFNNVYRKTSAGWASGSQVQQAAETVSVDDLEKMFGLVGKGILTQAEYEPKKQAFLGTQNSIDDLEVLATLKDKGAISGNDFDVKKKQILGL